MTDIMASPTPYQQTWWFELMGNKNAWQWQSPTTAEFRREMEGRLSLSRAGDAFLKWLEASDLDKPYLTPPATTHERIAPEQSTDTSIATEDAAIGLLGDLDRLRSDLSQLKSIKGASLRSPNPITPASVATGHEPLDVLLRNFYQALDDRIQGGHFTIEQIPKFFKTQLFSKKSTGLPTRQIRMIRQYVFAALISAFVEARHTKTGKLYDEAWAEVVNSILAADHVKIDCFVALVNQAPAADLLNIESKLCVQLVDDFFHAALKGNPKLRMLNWLVDTTSFAQALDRLPEATWAVARERIEAKIWDENLDHVHRFSALLVLSQSKRTPQHVITDMIRELAESGFVLARTEELEVAALRLISLGLLDFQAYLSWLAERSSQSFRNWTNLAARVVDLDRPDNLQYLVRWTRKSFDSDVLHRSLVLNQTYSDRPKVLEDGRRVITALLDMDDTSIGREPFLREMDATRQELTSRRAHQKSESVLVAEKQRLSDLLIFTAERQFVSENLTDRQVQKGLESCMRIYEKLNNNQGSSEMLVLVAKLLIRDLEAGMWGRSSRLDWLISKTRRYQGGKQALETLKELQRWRRMIDVQSSSTYVPVE